MTLVKSNACQTCETKEEQLSNFNESIKERTASEMEKYILEAEKLLKSQKHGSIKQAKDLMEPFSMKPSLAGVILT